MTQDIHETAGQALAECVYYSEGRPDDAALELATESVMEALKTVTGQDIDRERLEGAYRSALLEREKDSVLSLSDAAYEKPMQHFLLRHDGEIARDSDGRALFSLRDGGRYVAQLVRYTIDGMAWPEISKELAFHAGVLLGRTKEYSEILEDAPEFLESAEMIAESAVMELIRANKGHE